MDVTILEFFLRGIPESFLFIFAAYAFSNDKIIKKNYVLSGMTLAIAGFITRSLPVHYGVHTILNLFAFIVIASHINKIDLVKSMQAGIVAIILQFICEAINVFMIQYLFKANIEEVFNNATLKTLYGIPSTAIFAGIIFIYYFKVSKRNELKRF
jgi:uncharacterized membrane protein YagU involved in acid resistance